jgi:hypothetical protein
MSSLMEKIFPTGVRNPLDGLGIFIALVVVAVFFLLLNILCSATEDRFKEIFKLHLGSWVRLTYALTWIVMIAVGAGTRNWIFLGTVLSCAPLAWWLRIRTHRPQLVTAFACVALVVGAFAVDHLRKRSRRRGERVYFVLAFEGEVSRARDTEEIRQGWQDCRVVFAEVFRGLPHIEIKPTSASFEDYVYSPNPDFLARLRVDGVFADVVLRTKVGVYPEDGTIRLVLTMNQFVGSELGRVEGIEPKQIEGSIQDKEFLSLEAAQWVRGFLIPPEPTVLNQHWRRITGQVLLRKYAEFLSLQHHPPTELIAKVTTADPGNADIGQLLAGYTSSSAVDQAEQRAKDQRTMDIAKAGGAD